MRGSILLNFDEIVENHGADFVTVYVNNSVRKITMTECTNEFMTYVNTGDVVEIQLTPNLDYTGTTKEISVSRKDFTTDDVGSDRGIKNTFISSVSGTTYYLNTTFTATTVSTAYNFQYIVTVESCNTPVLTSSLTPAATCSSSTFNYIPTVSLEGSTYSWTRNVVAGISNPASSGTGPISETLINTTNAPISVPYNFNLFAIPGCTSSQTVTEVINPKPYVQNTTINFCSQSTVTITISNGGGDIVPTGTTYTWTVGNNSNITGQSNQPIPQTGITISLSNNTITEQSIPYYITPISPQGCIGDIFTFTMNVKPRVTNPQTSGTIYNNQTIDMTPVMTGSTLVPSGTTYTWTYTPITGVTGMTTQVVPATGITQTLTNTTTSRKTITYQITATTGTCSRTYTYDVLLYADPVVVYLDNPLITTWTSPSDVTTLYAECWGAGGGGGRANVGDFVSLGKARGGGGGAGAYAASQLSITGGTSYSIKVGRSTVNRDTWFISDTTLFAQGGDVGQATSISNGGIGAGGSGGSASLSIGTVKRSGGSGASASISNSPGYSGAGGGSGGSTGNGQSGVNPNGGYSNEPFYGKGGDSVLGQNNGQNAVGIGNGGSGGNVALNTSSSPGGAGTNGRIKLTYYL
jgi:hypothetical protein